MKKFEAPLISISVFDNENVVTASGTEAYAKAVEGLTTAESDLLNGKSVLNENSIVSFTF